MRLSKAAGSDHKAMLLKQVKSLFTENAFRNWAYGRYKKKLLCILRNLTLVISGHRKLFYLAYILRIYDPSKGTMALVTREI